jgi:L-ascorbate metabolism protein UlaG (beta-lactamase superfamily)
MGTKVQFFGVAGYKIVTSKGISIVVDPFITGNPYCDVKLEELGKVDILLLTHNAFDHFGDAPEIIRMYNPVTVCALDVQHNLVKYHGIDPDVIRPTIWNMELEIHGIGIRPVESHHWSFAKKEDGSLLSGPAMGFLIATGEKEKMYHPGDTAIFSDMKLIGELYKPTIGLMHVSLPSEEGVGMPHPECYKTGELTPAEALLASEWLGLSTVIASHYVDHECADVKEFSALVEENRQSGKYAPKVIILKNGEEIELGKR